MPELPEVQTVVDDLNKKIKGYEIVDFWSDWKKSIKLPLTKFKKEIIGYNIKNVKRRGKNILIYLNCRDALQCVSTEKIMLVHLKMTGHLIVKFPIINPQFSNKNKMPNFKYQNIENQYLDDRENQYIRHIWLLKKNKKYLTLEFSDLRKFAKIEMMKKIEENKELNKLGVEPLSRKFTEKKLTEILEKKKKTIIRNVLLDQNSIVGIGNIYVNEILFETGISPERLAGKINKKETEKLYKNIKKILTKAIKLRGTSDSDYRDTNGAPGGFQKKLKVYNRERQKCKRCGNKIKRKKIGQRSAYF